MDFLLEEGSKVSCDDTHSKFNSYGFLPNYYDEEKYKRLVSKVSLDLTFVTCYISFINITRFVGTVSNKASAS